MDRRNNFRRTGLLLLIALFSFTIYAQENFVPGYIIKNNNEKSEGYIDYRQWEKNPDYVNFRYGVADLPIRLTPTDIREFGVKDDVYVGAIVDTEVSTNDVNKLMFGSDLQIEIDTVFLQRLFSGDKELYYYLSKKGKENFYIIQDGKIALLEYKEYLKRIDGKGEVSMKNNKYLGQLTLYLNDCPDIGLRLKNTEYNKRSIEKLFMHYYKFKNPELASTFKRKKAKTEFGVLAGASLTYRTLDVDVYGALSVGDKNSLNFAGGIFFELISQRNQEKWSITNELFIASSSYDGGHRDELNSTTTIMDLEYTFLKLNTLARFKYPVGNTYWYINGGVSNGYQIKEKNHMVIESDYGFILREGNAYLSSRKRILGYIIGTGVKFKDYSFEIRVEKRDAGFETFPPDTKTMQYYFLLGYKF